MSAFLFFANILGWLVIIGLGVGAAWIFWALLVRGQCCRQHGSRNCGYCEYYGKG